MLVYYMFMLVLYFIYSFNVDHHGDRSRSYACASLSKQRPIVVMLTSPIRLCYFFLFVAPDWFQFCWQIALHSCMSPHPALWS
jgi:hypothetical protein